MTNHTHEDKKWKWWGRRAHLPPHLPKLVLADRYQPRYVRRCGVTQEACRLLRQLDWEQLPLSLSLNRQGERTIPLAAYVGAYLFKVDQQLRTFGSLRRHLRHHPGLMWALGFPLPDSQRCPDAHTIEAALPTQRHFARKLSRIPNEEGWTYLLVGDVFRNVGDV